MGMSNKKLILIDADVVSHFISAGKILLIGKIFHHKLKILDKVYSELERHRSRRVEVDNLLNLRILEIHNFPEENSEIKKEYFYLKNKLFKGEGESATLAVARYSNTIVASSNTKDIKGYCDLHQIEYLTTLDFLCEAKRIGLFTQADCIEFVESVWEKGSYLSVKSFTEYKCN